MSRSPDEDRRVWCMNVMWSVRVPFHCVLRPCSPQMLYKIIVPLLCGTSLILWTPPAEKIWQELK